MTRLAPLLARLKINHIFLFSNFYLYLNVLLLTLFTTPLNHFPGSQFCECQKSVIKLSYFSVLNQDKFTRLIWRQTSVVVPNGFVQSIPLQRNQRVNFPYIASLKCSYMHSYLCFNNSEGKNSYIEIYNIVSPCLNYY